MTGFGRTGRLFGCEHWDIRPDIMSVAKGLTSGYAPMGATIVSRRVEDAFADGPLMHLNTYAGHPGGVRGRPRHPGHPRARAAA